MVVPTLPLGKDNWFYETESTHQWRPVSVASNGQRGASICRCDVSGEEGCIRYDFDDRSFDGFKDKVCTDIGLMLNASVPASLLLPKNGSRNTFGVVGKVPSGLYQTLAVYKVAYELEYDNELWEEEISAIYPLSLIALDVLVGNRDRHVNLANTLLVEEGGQARLVGIDFNLSLGTKRVPWTNEGYTALGFENDTIPIPYFVHLTSEQRKELEYECDKAMSIPADVIEHLCERSASYYGHKKQAGIVTDTIKGILYRQSVLNGLVQECMQ
jgi:hypothetical protein